MRLACGLFAVIACSFGQLAPAKDPNALFGFGTMKCVGFVSASRDPQGKSILARPIFAWAQGWMSARNVAGRTVPLTVGGSLSADALEAMLVSECEDHPQAEVWQAVDSLYDRLAAKGL
jgi:hypothetical protein